MADNNYRTHVPMDSNVYQVRIDNISSSPATVYIPITMVGKVLDVRACIANAITSANATITVAKIAGGTATPVTLGTITITQSGSAGGNTFDWTIATTGTEDARTVNAGDSISVATDGGSSTSCVAWFTIVVDDF